MFQRLGEFVARHWLLVILVWLVGGVALDLVAPRWSDVTLDGDLDYLPADCTSVRGERLLAQAFPNLKAKSQIAVVIERTDGALTPDDDAAIVDLYHLLRQELGDLTQDTASGTSALITDFWCPVVLSSNDQGQRAIAAEMRSEVTENGQAALILIHLRNEFIATRNMQVLARVLASLDKFRGSGALPSHLGLGVAGSAAIGSDMLSSAAQSIQATESTTIVLILAILLLVYRAPFLAIIPLAVMFISMLVATDFVTLLADGSRRTDWYAFKVFKTTKIFLIAILFGSGTDYCLFLIARYREELGAGLSGPKALARSLGQTGVALAASALTTVLGLGMLVFAEFGKFRYAGPTLALAVGVVFLASVTLAPALLRLFGNLVFWPFGSPKPGHTTVPACGGLARRWAWFGDVIIARPGLILATSLLVLLPFAGYGLFCVETTYDLVSELSADRPSVQGTAMLRKHFPAGAGGPVNLVAYHPWADFRSRENGPNDDQLLIRDLTKYLESIEGVQRVRSWYTPFGEPKKRSSAAQQASQRSLAEDRFVSQAPEFEGRVTRMQLVLDHDPFALESAGRLEHLRSCLDQLSGGETPAHAAPLELAGLPLDQAWRGAQFELAGTTATTNDLRTVTTADNRKIQILCTLAVWAVMLVLLRRPVVCTYLIVSVLFTYFVSLGATQLVFQYAFGPEFIGLDWKVPLFLFVILVAVGADYNIYLVTRVFEEQQRLGLLEGLREAMARTGGIISSCGLIMVGSFLSMMSGTLHAILELGFALSLGILLDTFVVRPILVPAFLAFVYRWQLRRESSVIEREVVRPARPLPAPHHDSAAELVKSI